MTENPIGHDIRVKPSGDDQSVHHVFDIDIARKAEEAADQRDIKKVFDSTRLLGEKRNVQRTPVMNKNGVVLTRTNDQFNRWNFQKILNRHFQKILNRPAQKTLPDSIEENALPIQRGKITMGKVKKALKTSKNGKDIRVKRGVHARSNHQLVDCG